MLYVYRWAIIYILLLAWTDNTKYILLLNQETFEGNGYAVNLTGVSNWEGLFRIAHSLTNGDALVILNLHDW